MKIGYTFHAEYMIEKRKLQKFWVEEAIKYPDKLEKYKGKYYARRRLDGVTIEVVYEREKHIKIITVYPV